MSATNIIYTAATSVNCKTTSKQNVTSYTVWRAGVRSCAGHSQPHVLNCSIAPLRI